MPKLRYLADIDTKKLFFNVKPHIDYASVVWDRCNDVLKRSLNSLHRRVVNLIFPDTTPTADQKLKKTKITSLHKQLEYKKGTESTLTVRPQSIYLTCTHFLPHAILTLRIIS